MTAKANRAPSHIEAEARRCITQYDEGCAIDRLTELELRRPLRADESQWLGVLLWARANRYAVTELYRPAVRVYERAQRLVKLPPMASWYVAAGDAALGTGNREEARRFYGHAAVQEPNHTAIPLRAWLLSVRHKDNDIRFDQPAPPLPEIGEVLRAKPAHGFRAATYAYLSMGGSDPLVLQAAIVIAQAAADPKLELAVKAAAGTADLGRRERFANAVTTCPRERLARSDAEANAASLTGAACALVEGRSAWAARLLTEAVVNSGDPAATLFASALLWEAHRDDAHACAAWTELFVKLGPQVPSLVSSRLTACLALFPQLRPSLATTL